MKRIFPILQRWASTAAFLLFLAQMLLLPLSGQYTYAGPAEAPGHVLTYTQNSLSWDRDTPLRHDGTALLDLFDPAYDGTVRSADGGNVVAPGTGNQDSVRLHNRISGSITYTAVLYAIQTEPDLPVRAQLAGGGRAATRYALPAGVSRSQVLQAVTGTLGGGQRKDFTIHWSWPFESGGDLRDTALGIRNPADEITLGLYVVVEDDNCYTTPKTGDDFGMEQYLCVLILSGGLLIILLLKAREEKYRRQEALELLAEQIESNWNG